MEKAISEYSTEAPLCDFGSMAKMATSWEKEDATGFAHRVWDPPITGRARDLINQFARARKLVLREVLPKVLRSNMLHAKNNQRLRTDLKEQEKTVKLLICVIGFLVVLVSGMFGYIIS